MGFGWLMVGYFFANVVSLYSPLSFAMLAGYPMISWGLWHLAPYHKRFFDCFCFSLVGLPFAIYFSLFAFGEMGLGIPAALFGASVFGVMEWLYFFFNLAFHLFLLYGIVSLANELGLQSHASVAWRNILLVLVFCVLYTFLNAFPATAAARFLAPIVILLKLFYIFLNVYLLYQCDRYICPEENAIREGEEEARAHRRAEEAQRALKEKKKGRKRK